MGGDIDFAQALKWILPSAAWHRVRILKLHWDDFLRPLFRIAYRGTTYQCPICLAGIRTFRSRRTCPVCRSRDRHRLAFIAIQRETDLLYRSGARFLHVAPEPSIMRAFRRTFDARYVSADLHNPAVNVNLDIQNLPFADASFDGIYCSHVLEHVQNDLRAISELHRVLRPTGTAFIQVPIIRGKTFRDPAITTRQGRLEAYGQIDHYVAYGWDFADRLGQAGFQVRTLLASTYFSVDERHRLDVAPEECVFLCRRPS